MTDQSTIINISDNLQNAISGLSGKSDKSAFSTFITPRLSAGEIIAAYRGSAIVKKIVDIPPFDACREWRTWSGEAEQTLRIVEVEKYLNVRSKVREALTLARLLGGSAILIGDDSESPDMPLEPDRMGVGALKYLTVLSLQNVSAGGIETNAYDRNFGKPKYYILNAGNETASVNVHPSRMAIFNGHSVPTFFADVNDGWGDSVLLSMMKDLKNLEATAQNIAGLVFEAKIDIIKIQNLAIELEDGGKEAEKLLIKRVQAMNMSKGNLSTIIMDATEEWEQKQIRFGTLPQVLEKFMQLASAAASIPVTRLFEVPPSGLNATGKSDERNYYDRISATQTLEIQPSMGVLDRCIVQSAIGSYPDDVNFTWNSLWQVTDKEKADTGLQYANIIEKIIAMGDIDKRPLVDGLIDILTGSEIISGLSTLIEDYENDNPRETKPEQTNQPIDPKK